MMKALRLGLFIGTLIGASACAAPHVDRASAVDAG